MLELISYSIAVNDIAKFDFVVEGAEMIAHMIDHYAIFENLCLQCTSPATDRLVGALVQLYAAILRYLSKFKG